MCSRRESFIKNALLQRIRCRSITGLLVGVALLQTGALQAESVAVHHKEGTVHGFLVLRTMEGKTLAEGALTQVVQKDRLVSNLLS